jgi:general secretion pathway protein I
LVEVLVALVVVALGLAALMVAVQGAARTSGYLRDKTLAQWIALNRIAEVRITINKLATQSNGQNIGQNNNDTGQVDFAARTWHYDTRYFDTTFPGMKRIVVRVWAGDAKTKGNPIAESTSFLGASIGQAGISNIDWTVGSTASTACGAPGGALGGGNTANGTTGLNGATGLRGTTGLNGTAGLNGTTGLNGATGGNCTPAAGTPTVNPTLAPTIPTPNTGTLQ